MALGVGEQEPPDDNILKQKLEKQSLSRPTYCVYDTVPDDIIKVADRPSGMGPRSGQTAPHRIIRLFPRVSSNVTVILELTNGEGLDRKNLSVEV